MNSQIEFHDGLNGSGLFSQAIMESGSAFGGGVSLCNYRNSSIALAITLGCATADQWNSGQNFAVGFKLLNIREFQLNTIDQTMS